MGVDIQVFNREPHFDLGAATHRLLVRLYNWFGFEDEAVPYRNEQRTAIEIEQIWAARMPSAISNFRTRLGNRCLIHCVSGQGAGIAALLRRLSRVGTVSTL